MKTLANRLQILTNFSYLAITYFLMWPFMLQAQDDGCNPAQEICNPLAATDIRSLIADVLDAVLVLAVPVIVFFIIYAGFLFVTAGGDEKQIENAKKTALYTAIGAAIILGAEVLSDVLAETARELGADIPDDV